MKRPNPFLYLPFAGLLYVIAFFKRQRIIKDEAISKPSIIIANHTSFYDFIYSTTALFPKRLTYVAVDKMYYTKPAGFFMRMARSIPKCLFQSDIRSTKSIMEILKKKGMVCLYPEGQISSYGETLEIPFQIAKLVKKAQVDVYMCKHHGAYFSNPPWSKKSFKGNVMSHVFPLLKTDEISQQSVEEIYNKITKGMYYNASLDNQVRKWTYNIHDLSNFENVLYQCPSCDEKTLISQKTELICTHCGHRLKMDLYGQLDGKTISEFYHRQEDAMRKEIQDKPDFQIQSEVDLESYKDGTIKVVGSGVFIMNQNDYRYIGTMFDKEVELTFDPKRIPTLPSDIGRNVQIYHDYRLYQFVIKGDKKRVMQMVIFAELLYKTKNNIIKTESKEEKTPFE